ncbi:MAG: polysaccharide biosynthesis C-terminal domain-containing protein [Planctomycetota bacterium]
MFKQSVLVSGARVIDKAMSLAIVLVMARHFGEQGMGEFYYYFSLASLFIPLIDVSTGMTLLQRWHERDEHGRRLLMTQLVILKFALGILALALALGGDAISKWGAPNVLAVSAALLAIFFDDISELLRRPAHAQGKYALEVITPLISRVVQLVLVFVFLSRMTNGFQVIYIFAAANLVETLISIYGTAGCVPTVLAGSKRGDWWDILKNGAPFAMSGLFCMASLHFDSVMLASYSMKAVGAYGSAVRIIMVMNVLNGGVCHALFPKLIKAKAEKDRGHIGWLINGTLRGFIVLFGAISIGGIAIGPQLMATLYGDKFPDTGAIFRFLSPIILLAAFYSLLGQCLEILGEQAKVMRIYALSAAVNIVGNLLLIPQYGMFGAAAATLVSSLITVIMLFVMIYKNKDVIMTDCGLGRAAIFLAIIAVFFAPLAWLSVWIAVPLGALFFAALLLPFRSYWFAGMGRLAGEKQVNCEGTPQR